METGGVVLAEHTRGIEREKELVGALVGPWVIVITGMEWLTWVGGG